MPASSPFLYQTASTILAAVAERSTTAGWHTLIDPRLDGQRTLRDAAIFGVDLALNLVSLLVPPGVRDLQTVASGALMRVIGNAVAPETLADVCGTPLPQPTELRPYAALFDLVDALMNAPDLFAAQDVLEKQRLPFRTALHSVTTRGLTTTLLHQAASAVFHEAGWQPLILNAQGTLYVSVIDQAVVPTREHICERLAQTLLPYTPTPDMVVGRSVVAALLPAPNLYNHTQLSAYLTVAFQRVSPSAFLKKPFEERRERVQRYAHLCDMPVPSDDDTITKLSAFISQAQVESVPFHFVKTVLATFLTAIPLKQRKPVIAAAAATVLTPLIAEAFVQLGSFNPISDAAHLLRPLWKLPASAIGGDTETPLGALAPKLRHPLIIAALVRFVDACFATLPADAYPTAVSPQLMADAFLRDLVVPAPEHSDPRALAGEDLARYGTSKEAYGRAARPQLCPICNMPFFRGMQVRESFVTAPEAYSNRAPAFVSGGRAQPLICHACAYERLLYQMVLGTKPEAILLLTPRGKLGPARAAILAARATELAARANALLHGADAAHGLSFALTEQIAWKLGAHGDAVDLSVDAIVDSLTYQNTADKRKDRHTKLLQALAAAYEVEVAQVTTDQVNTWWDTAFPDLDTALTALQENRVPDQLAREVRAQVLGRYPPMLMVWSTPHLVVVPMRSAIGKRSNNDTKNGKKNDTKNGKKDDNETNRALRQLYVTLFIGLALDCTATLISPSDALTWTGATGVTRMPAVAVVQQLVRTFAHQLRLPTDQEWIGSDLALPLLKRIGAAARICDQTGWSEGSRLYDVLKCPYPGQVLRRIELHKGYVTAETIAAVRELSVPAER